MANRKLVVEIVGDASSLQRTFRAATGEVQRFSIGIGSLVKATLVIGAVQKAIQGLSATVHLGIEEFQDNAKVAAQTAAAIKSTGGIAGVTAKHVDALGLSLSNLSGIDDEVVRAGENVLLSFRNIRNQAGKGNDVFDRATKAVVNFAARTGRDVPQAANILGRALEDPARKAASLARAGIVLSASQLKLIKRLEDSGNALGAQKLLLAQLEDRFGGAAAAAGKTLGGQLNVLRERFKDLAGSGIALIAPSVARAAAGLTGLVRKLSEASGAGAKFKILGSALSDLDSQFKQFATRLITGARRAFDNIDWRAVFDGVRQGFVTEFRRLRTLFIAEIGLFADVAKTVGDALRRGFNAVDWNAVGRTVLRGLARLGRLAGQAITGLLTLITQALQHVNFQKVGKALVDGFALAVAAVGTFLLHVNWAAVIGASIRLAIAAIRATGSLLLGAGRELGSALLRGISQGLKALGGALERQALQIVLKVLKALDFKVLGHHVIPGINSLVNSIQSKIDSLHGKNVTVTVTTRNVTENVKAKVAPLDLGQVQLALDAARKRKPITVPVKAKIDTKLDTGFGLQDQGAKAAKAAQASTDALTRLLGVLNLAVQKATLTKTFKDDLAANQALISALTKQIALHKNDLDLQNQLVSAQQARIDLVKQQNDAEVAARSARQFRALGLGPTGEDLVPGVRNLQKQLASLSTRVMAGAPISRKLQSQLKAVRKILSGELGQTTKDVRAKIAELFQAIRDGFNQQTGPLTKTHALDTSSLVKGLGLDRATMNALRARLSKFNTAGVALGPQVAFAGAGGLAGAGAIRIDNRLQLNIDGRQVEHAVTKHQQRRILQNPSSRRGRR